MVTSVSTNQVTSGNYQGGKGFHFAKRNFGSLPIGVALVMVFLSAIAWGANELPAAGTTPVPPATTVSSTTTATVQPGSNQGEAWVTTTGTSTTSGTVATVPAVATGVTPLTPPTPPTPNSVAAPARAMPKPSSEEVEDANPEALTYFRPHLEPYGRWIDDPRYGRVWVPNRAVVGDQFSPYVTNGRWALDSDDNWNWVSDYPFGWVVFHYGRWFYSAEYGWAWVPGRTYAPNWVVWRLPTAEYNYVGWAPMPPRYGWFSTGAVWYSSYGTVSYVFCPSDYLFYPGVGLYLVHDPWMVSRLGIYTSFYYPPYYYGYYGYSYPHYHGHAGYRPPAYGPPINRTRISPRAIPRERVAADPRAVAAAPRRSASPTGSSGFGGFQRSPASRGSSFVAPGRSRGSFDSGSRTQPSRLDSRSASPSPRFSPRSDSPSSPRAASPRASTPLPSTPSVAPRVRSSGAPTFRSTPSYRPPSVRSTPSFPRSGGGSMPHFSPRSFGGGRRGR
jgi:hypothetical protein